MKQERIIPLSLFCRQKSVHKAVETQGSYIYILLLCAFFQGLTVLSHAIFHLVLTKSYEVGQANMTITCSFEVHAIP